jgi:membrane-associated phospholipid phosphatase
VAAALFALVYVLFVHTGPARNVDDAALLERSTAVEISPVAVELVDLAAVVLAVVIFGALALKRGDPRLAVAGTGVIVASMAIAMLLARTLPQVSTTPSFPSGHATLAMAIACGLVLTASASWRQALVSIAALLAVVVGIGLITLDWHRPSEIAAGYLLAFACTCLAVAFLDRARPKGAAARDPAWTARRVSIVALAGIAAFALLLAIVNLADALDRDLVGDWVALLVGELILVALALILLRTLASLAVRAPFGPTHESSTWSARRSGAESEPGAIT